MPRNNNSSMSFIVNSYDTNVSNFIPLDVWKVEDQKYDITGDTFIKLYPRAKCFRSDPESLSTIAKSHDPNVSDYSSRYVAKKTFRNVTCETPTAGSHDAIKSDHTLLDVLQRRR